MPEPKPSGNEVSGKALDSKHVLQKDLKAIIAEKEKPEISISRATLEDAQRFDRDLPYGPPDFHEYMYNRMSEGKSILLLAKEKDKPVGRLLLELEGPSGPKMEPEVTQAFEGVPEITGAEIADEYRGKGIGSDLIAILEAEAKALGFEKVCIGAATSNPDARRLYEKLGYRDYSKPRHKTVESNGEIHEVIYLEKTL